VWQHLSHPFVLPFVGLFQPSSSSGSLPYMVSEYAPNGTLRAFIKTDAFVPSVDTMRLVSTRDIT
jgi:serine/threonine protein kinase